jgi:hypothetical protein
MGYIAIFDRIEPILRERGEIIVSPDWDNLVRGSDCLHGDLDLWYEYSDCQLKKDFHVRYYRTLKDGRSIYRLVRKEKP